MLSPMRNVIDRFQTPYQRATAITYSEMVTFYPRIETISDDPPKNCDGRIQGRYGVFFDNPEGLEQGELSHRYREWSVSNLNYFYNVEPRMPKPLTEDGQDTPKYVLTGARRTGGSEEIWVPLSGFRTTYSVTSKLYLCLCIIPGNFTTFVDHQVPPSRGPNEFNDVTSAQPQRR